MKKGRAFFSDRPLALVLGSTGGIGACVAERLAKEGYDLILHHRKSDARITTLVRRCAQYGSACTAALGDITDDATFARILRAVRARKKLDVVVNTIAHNKTQGIANLSEVDFSHSLLVNVVRPACLIKQLVPFLKQSKRGRLIFFSSIVAFVGSPRRTGYVSSKAGVTGLMHALALELAPSHVTVNAIVPSYIDTPSYRTHSTISTKERVRDIPLARLGKPDDVASVVCFLSSKDASYVTGQSLHVNGGTYLT